MKEERHAMERIGREMNERVVALAEEADKEIQKMVDDYVEAMRTLGNNLLHSSFSNSTTTSC